MSAVLGVFCLFGISGVFKSCFCVCSIFGVWDILCICITFCLFRYFLEFLGSLVFSGYKVIFFVNSLTRDRKSAESLKALFW